jgi:VCBS repeat-containing protein
MTRLSLGVLAALTALVAAAPAGAAQPQRADRPLRDADVRRADGGPVSPGERRARGALARDLGDEAVVETDPVGGGARMVARTNGSLTRRRSAPATDIALDYVRAHPDVFGVDASDLAGLRLTSRYSSGGVTHLAWSQTFAGVAAYDNVLLANVTDDGRLLNAGGSAVSGLHAASVVPDLSAGAALALARQDVGGALVAPRGRQGRGPERPTTFSNGDRARLVLFSDGSSTRLAWKLYVHGARGYGYEVVVDATGGTVLKRRSLTDFAASASVYENYPGAPLGGTPHVVDIDQPTWLSQTNAPSIAPPAGPKLSGNNTHVYVDADTANFSDAVTQAPGPTAGDLEVPPSSAGAQNDWVYTIAPFALPGCPASGCTWNSAVPSTRTTNRNEAATQLFYLVNKYHDHLDASPIGFTPATGNFELAPAPGSAGGDPVVAETDNYLNPSRTSATSVNNANMETPPDGLSPRMQMYLFTSPSLNAADTADVVYHEYTHGLTNRSVGSGVGLDADQSQAMGEGWSDWYALDYLNIQALRPDTPARGEMRIGEYLQAGGLRTQGADCPVGTNDPACPGTGPGNRGGYTLGDLGHVSPTGFEVHADGEIWLETLWDIRQALTPTVAESLITEGLRLAPNNPSFLEARDAILLADQAHGGPNYDALWNIFRLRGMGFSATTPGSTAHTAVEAFDVPPPLVHVSTAVHDAQPGGDDDDVVEPGETFTLDERLRDPDPTPAGGVTSIAGVLSTAAPGFTIGQPNATWQPIGVAQEATNDPPPMRVTAPTIAAGATCDTSVPLTLTVTTGSPSASFPIALRVPIGSRFSDDPPQPISPGAAGINSTVTFGGAGMAPISDLEVRIAKLSHTFVGDLVITLTHDDPSFAQPKTVVLMNSPGAGVDGASGDDFSDLVLDDDAATPIESLPATNPPGGYTGRYKPDQPLSVFDGDDRHAGTWTLHVRDRFARSDSGTLTSWGIRPSGADCPNRAPEAGADAFSVAGGQPLTGNVLANDDDPDGDPITAAQTSPPGHGTLALAPDGSFTYTPQASFRGADSFSYEVSDGHLSAPAVATISVGNRAPVAVDDAYAAAAGVTLNAPSLLANDSDPNGDPMTAALVAGPAHGTLSLAANGTFAYTADASFAGRDAFTYRATDGIDASAPATAIIDVTGATVQVPTPPPPPTPQPPPPPPPPPPPVITPRAPAKLQVLRAGVSGGRLDVLASITARATGSVSVRYRSGGRTTTFDAAIAGGQIRLRKVLPPAQRAKPTGIFSLTFAGTTLVQPDSVQLRAAAGRAQLVRTASRIDASGTLRVAGTISPRVRGVVRVRLGVVGAGDTVTFLSYTAKIAAGRWALVQKLPPAAAEAGGQLSIQFTGYEALRIRGEQISKEVSPAG